MRKKHLSLIAVLWLVSATILLAQDSSNISGIFQPVDESELTPSQLTRINDLRYQPYVRAAQIVLIQNLEGIVDAASLTLNLNDNVRFTATFTESKSRGRDEFSWIGKPEKDIHRGEYVILEKTPQGITGIIWYNGTIYSLVPISGDIHILKEIDQTRLPPDHPPGIFDNHPDSSQSSIDSNTGQMNSSPQVQNASETTIQYDLLVVYTPAAKAAAGDIDGLINGACNQANQVYSNSLTTPRTNLVLKQEIIYTEVDMFTDLARLVNQSDGYMDEVHTIRDQYGADVVILILASGEFCGLAKDIEVGEDEAFAVVSYACIEPRYTITHEIGHLFGSEHDMGYDPDPEEPYPYNHGFNLTQTIRQTIMAIKSQGATPRIPYLSTPANIYSEPIGSINRENNARVHNDRASTIANFRPETNPPITLCGELISNEIWSGNISLQCDVIIPENITLTIQPGTVLTFPDYVEMYVRGTLNAEGTSYSKITFKSEDATPNNSENAYLVRLNNSSGSNLEYCKFQYAYRGIYSYNSTADITNCEFENCYYGIYVNNCTGNLFFHDNNINNCSYGVYNYYSHPDIRDNEIDVSSYGIYNYRSSPNIYSNDIEGGAFGMRCASYSSPQMCGYAVPGYNQIHDNFMIGVYCEDNSNPFMGSAYCVMHGYNSLTNNEEGQVSAGSNCSVIAEENWWGRDNPPSGWFSGDVDYIPYLSSPPSKAKQKSPEDEDFDIAFENVSKNIDGGIVMSFFDPTWNLRQKTRFIHALIYNGDPQSAQAICKDIIANYPDSSLAFFALDLLWQSSRQPNMTTGFNMTAFKSYLPTLANRQDNKLLYGSAALLLAGFEGDKGLLRIDNVFNNYRNTYLAEAALFQKFMFYLNDKEDVTEARKVLNTMDQLFPKSTYTLQAHHMLGDPVNWKQSSLAKRNNNTLLEENINLPEKYKLVGAFPNPFNPETNIKYELPRMSQVEVNIYNMLGQKVMDLKIPSQNGGIHNIKWNGTNSYGNRIPSGVYVIHFKAISLEGKEEIYEKSFKVTLLK